MDNIANLLNHTRVAPLRVVGKEQLNISFRGCCRLKIVLKVMIWSSRSFRPSNDSSCADKTSRARDTLGLLH